MQLFKKAHLNQSPHSKMPSVIPTFKLILLCSKRKEKPVCIVD